MRNSHAAHSSPPNGPTGLDGPAPLTPRQERAAAACRAELRNVPANPGDSPDSRPTTDDSTTTGANGAGDPVPGGGPAGATGGGGGAAATGAGPANSAALLCSAGWRRAAMARAAASAYVRRVVKRNATSLAQIEEGVDAVCRGVHGIEARLSCECSNMGHAGDEGGTAAEEGEGESRTEVHQGARTSTTEKSNPSPTCPICHYLHSTHPPPSRLPGGAGHEGAQVPRVCLLQATRSSSFLFRRNGDVLVWVKTTYDRVAFHRSTDDTSFQMLPYSQAWHTMAHRAMAHLPPRYIAVHYRSKFIAFHLFIAFRLASSLPSASRVHRILPREFIAFRLASSSPSASRVHRLPPREFIAFRLASSSPSASRVHRLPPREFIAFRLASSSPSASRVHRLPPREFIAFRLASSSPSASRVHRLPPREFIAFRLASSSPSASRVHRLPPREFIAFRLASSSPSASRVHRLPPREFIAFRLAHKLVQRGFKVEAGVLEELMAGCMEAARDLINGMKGRHNISAVFIVADVPFDDKAGSVVRSDSWKMTTWMFQGQARVLKAPREKLRWLRELVAGTVMVDELMPAINHYDPGQCTLPHWLAA
ncbi:unnamed protein product [Closterium sp. NIES-64]|nr:unnamed protein product [Closterium sp. NIES-64]